jgi:hypothetical protein
MACEWCLGTHQKEAEEAIPFELQKAKWGKSRGVKVLKKPAKVMSLCLHCKTRVQRQLDEAAEAKARAAAER